jgi:hypothetical protein
MRFDYVAREVDPLPGQESPCYVREPIILVEVVGPSGRVQLIRGLVDTGADFTLLPGRYLPRFGLSPADLPRASLSGAGGNRFSPYLATVNLTLRSPSGRVAHEWSALVGFEVLRERALWGRDGFLEYFMASFHGPANRFTLLARGEFPEPIQF